jgi:hypothetical protein
VEVHQTTKKGVRWGNGGDFVLAFRVKRFKVSRRGIKEVDFTSGSVLRNDQKKVERGYEMVLEEGEDEFEIDDENPDWKGVRVTEGDEDVVVAVPRAPVHENEN